MKIMTQNECPCSINVKKYKKYKLNRKTDFTAFCNRRAGLKRKHKCKCKRI